MLASLALGTRLIPCWYLFTAFVGLNLFQSGFTNRGLMISYSAEAGREGLARGYSLFRSALSKSAPRSESTVRERSLRDSLHQNLFSENALVRVFSLKY